MGTKRLIPALLVLALAGSLAVADDWFGSGNERHDSADEAYSDPWDTAYDNDLWHLAGEQADEDGEPARFQMYDDRGRQTGRVESDPLTDDGYTVYVHRGHRTGRVEKNPAYADDYTVYDERGRRTREIRKNRFLEGQYDVYDEKGRRIGQVRESSIIDGQYDIYDEQGRRVGRVEEN
jgi:uncharacterized protein YxjI